MVLERPFKQFVEQSFEQLVKLPLKQSICSITKMFLFIYDETQGVEDQPFTLDLGIFEDLVYQRIDDFTKEILELTNKDPNNLYSKLTDYLINLSKKNGFSHKNNGEEFDLKEYFKDQKDTIEPLKEELQIQLPLIRFLETIDCEKVIKRFRGRPRTPNTVNAIRYFTLKKFCNSSNEEFNEYIDEKINGLIE